MTTTNNLYKTSVIGLFFLSLGACTTTTEKEQASAGAEVEDRGTVSIPVEESSDVVITSVGDSARFEGHPLDDPSGVLAKRKVYFDYDKSDIKDEYRPVIEAHADYLARNPQHKITIEGHCDERGSREYNLALGERRAAAVKGIMELMGVAPDQIRMVSYGEERPEADGHDESAWQFNRRAVIVYRTR